MSQFVSIDRFYLASIMMALLLSFGVSCASSSGGDGASTASVAPPPAAAAATSANVTVDASALQGDRLDSYLRHGGSSAVSEAVAAALAGTGSSAGSVTVRITDYRLRSTSSALWLGAMAGADTIKCQVEAGSTNFSTDTSTIMGGFIMPGSQTRFNRLVRELSNRIAEGVR